MGPCHGARSWSLQLGRELPEPPLHPSESVLGITYRKTRRDDPGPALQVVPTNDPVVQADSQIGSGELIEAGPGETLGVVTEVVAKQTGGAALERRQPRHRRCTICRQQVGQEVKRVGLLSPKRLELAEPAGTQLPPDVSAAGTQPAEWVGRHERVAAQDRVPIGAVKKQQTWQVGQAATNLPG